MSVVVNPSHAEILRYVQTAETDVIIVTKKIATSASILHLLKTGPFSGTAKCFRIAGNGNQETTYGRLRGYGVPANHFPCQKFSG